jgi:hypothetical protein
MTPTKDAAPRLSAPATKTGAMGKAWKLDLEAWRARYPGKSDGGICGWIVEAPWAHPMWHSYFLSAVHLRELPGMPPARIYLPGATHEVMLFALDPYQTPRLDEMSSYLMPANFTGQWIAESDEAAVAKVEATVDDILAGRLSPDTDHLRSWMERFSDSNVKAPWKELGGSTLVGVSGDTAVIVGTGKTAADVLTTMAVGPKPPRGDMH